MASSVMLSLPRVTAPAATSRATAVQSCSAVKYSAVRVPQEVGSPRMKQRSLNASGTPWSGPRVALRPAASRRRAAASAPSASTVMKARSRPSSRSTRARHARVASTGESWPAWIAAASAVMVGKSVRWWLRAAPAARGR